MKEEILNEITELQEEIERLDREYKIYSEHSEEESEPIKYNIDKKKMKIQEVIKPVKEELKEKEEIKNNKIEEITKEAEERLERLEREYKIYSEHSEKESEPIKNNIDKIKWELEKNIKSINEQFETEKESILSQIEKTGIDLEEYGLKEPEEKEPEEKEPEEKEAEEKEVKEIEKEEKKEEKDETKIVNPIIADKPIQTHKPKVVNVGEGKAKTTFTAQELEAFTKDEDIEIIDLNKEEKKINKNNEAVRIFYSAKTDKYVVTNVNTGEQKIVERKNIEKLDRNLLAEKMGKDLNNVDTNILQLLISYDEKYKTTKANDYIETLSKIGKNKEQRQNEMKESQIEIEYNLKGLYNKKSIVGEDGLYTFEDNFSKEEREELLQIANNAKTKGIATVKKGPKVFINELIRRRISKIKGVKVLNGNKILSLPQTKKQKEYEQRKQEGYDKLTNREYMKSLDKDFRKAVRTERVKKAFENKIKVPNITEKNVRKAVNEPRTVDGLMKIEENMDIIQERYDRLIDENGRLRQELHNVKKEEKNIENNEEER